MIQEGRSSNVPVDVFLSGHIYVIPAVCLSRVKVCPGTVRSSACVCGSGKMDGNIQVLTDCDPVYLIISEIHSFHYVHIFMYIFL